MRANIENISSRIQQEAEQAFKEAIINLKKIDASWICEAMFFDLFKICSPLSQQDESLLKELNYISGNNLI